MTTYYCLGARKIKGQRVTLFDLIRMRKAKNRKRKEWKLLCGY